MNKFRRSVAFLALVSGVLLNAAAYAQNKVETTAAPSIGGYSPVSYFTENKAERGSAEFAVEHEGRVYFLTSQEQVEIYSKNPEKYRPRHKSCPFSLAYGMVLPLDPTNFKIVGDSLLLFHRSEEKNALLEWNSSKLTDEELLRRADANVFLIDF